MGNITPGSTPVYRHGGHISGRTYIFLKKYKGEQLNSFPDLEILAMKKVKGMWSNNTGDAKIEGGIK